MAQVVLRATCSVGSGPRPSHRRFHAGRAWGYAGCLSEAPCAQHKSGRIRKPAVAHVSVADAASSKPYQPYMMGSCPLCAREPSGQEAITPPPLRP